MGQRGPLHLFWVVIGSHPRALAQSNEQMTTPYPGQMVKTFLGICTEKILMTDDNQTGESPARNVDQKRYRVRKQQRLETSTGAAWHLQAAAHMT
ncbi:hypothetical protein E4U41_000847 [Claviceps citrina]|nr:hypothetical protein E4U41_000847 [Claviceps citrina]